MKKSSLLNRNQQKKKYKASNINQQIVSTKRKCTKSKRKQKRMKSRMEPKTNTKINNMNENTEKQTHNHESTTTTYYHTDQTDTIRRVITKTDCTNIVCETNEIRVNEGSTIIQNKIDHSDKKIVNVTNNTVFQNQNTKEIEVNLLDKEYMSSPLVKDPDSKKSEKEYFPNDHQHQSNHRFINPSLVNCFKPLHFNHFNLSTPYNTNYGYNLQKAALIRELHLSNFQRLNYEFHHNYEYFKNLQLAKYGVKKWNGLELRHLQSNQHPNMRSKTKWNNLFCGTVHMNNIPNNISTSNSVRDMDESEYYWLDALFNYDENRK